MLTELTRRRVAALRQPAAAARLARALWIAWAVVVWNVVFDRTIVVTGRRYVAAASRASAADPGAPAVNMDDWMEPAVARGLWLASGAAGAILLVGLPAIRSVHRRRSPRGPDPLFR
jgi:CTP:molybdopterin cytidylyltransferase MocA